MIARIRSAVITALAVSLLIGCAAPVPAISVSVSVSVYQGRADLADRRMQIAVTNTSDVPLTITDARLTSPGFTDDAVWAKDSTEIPAGATRDLPVALPAPECSAEATVTVTIEVRSGDHTSTISAPATDTYGHLARVRGEDCLGAALDRVMELSLSMPREVEGAGGRSTQLDLILTPTGSGTATVEAVQSTVLLSLVDSTGALVESQTVAGTITPGSGETRLPLTLAPARCDPHAVAEDKRGTLLPVSVRLSDDTTGTVLVPASAEVRAALYAFVAEACGFPE